MNYKEVKRLWHTRFLSALKKYNITKAEFLQRTNVCTTNGSCYFKGTKVAGPQKLANMADQCGIPLREVFFPA